MANSIPGKDDVLAQWSRHHYGVRGEEDPKPHEQQQESQEVREIRKNFTLTTAYGVRSRSLTNMKGLYNEVKPVTQSLSQEDVTKKRSGSLNVTAKRLKDFFVSKEPPKIVPKSPLEKTGKEIRTDEFSEVIVELESTFSVDPYASACKQREADAEMFVNLVFAFLSAMRRMKNALAHSNVIISDNYNEYLKDKKTFIKELENEKRKFVLELQEFLVSNDSLLKSNREELKGNLCSDKEKDIAKAFSDLEAFVKHLAKLINSYLKIFPNQNISLVQNKNLYRFEVENLEGNQDVNQNATPILNKITSQLSRYLEASKSLEKAYKHMHALLNEKNGTYTAFSIEVIGRFIDQIKRDQSAINDCLA